MLKLTKEIIASQKLTTLMVTHSMRQALEVGSRTLMLHQGKVAFDIQGEERAGMQGADLLQLFERQRGESVSDDALLLG